MMMNSHFAGVGEDASKKAYEHGIQVIDEDKVFKYVQQAWREKFGGVQC
tara:strand:- start:10705 stop:10851 length:147 start_codon:yes stop_codon:yes gene_type:complete